MTTLNANDAKKSPMDTYIDHYEQLIQSESLTTIRFGISKGDLHPCLYDNTSYTGFDRHYIYHPAWAARIVRSINPKKHIDISSSLHFCSMLSAFIPVDFYDYRPANLRLKNLNSISGDLMALPFRSDSVKSISCMHTVEHIGLGRYGDPIDYDGDIKAIDELVRVLASGGHLLFVVPLGAEDRICFNAHRIYSKSHVLALFSNLKLRQFALIPENESDGGLIVNPSAKLLLKQRYGCGCFWFSKE